MVERSCSSNCNKRFPFSVKFVNDSERSPRVVPISAAEQPPAAALVLVVLHEVWFVCAGRLQAGLGQLGCGQTAGELSNSVTWRLAAAAGGGVMLNLALTSTTQQHRSQDTVLWCCGAVVLDAGPPHPFMCVVLSALLPPLYSYHTSTSFHRGEFFDKAGITS